MKKLFILFILTTICFISYGQKQEWDDVKIYYFKIKLENNQTIYIKKTLPLKVKYKRISEPLLIETGWGFDSSKDLCYRVHNLPNGYVILKKNVIHFKVISKIEYINNK